MPSPRTILFARSTEGTLRHARCASRAAAAAAATCSAEAAT